MKNKMLVFLLEAEWKGFIIRMKRMVLIIFIKYISLYRKQDELPC